MKCTQQEDNYDLVKSSLLAAELTDKQVGTLARVVEVCHLKDGEILIEEGHRNHSLFVITRGKLAVVKKTGGDRDEVLHIHKSGEIAGAMGFLDGLEHSATLRASDECAVYRLDRDKFEELLKTDPEIVYMVMRAIIRGVHAIVRNMNNHYIQLTNYIAKQHGRY